MKDYEKVSIGPREMRVPRDWNFEPLSKIAQPLESKINPENHAEELFELYSIPAYREDREPRNTLGKDIHSQKLVVENNAVLFGCLNPRVPKIWFVSSNSSKRKIASTEFMGLRANDMVKPSFLYYLSWSPFLLCRSRELVRGSTPSRLRVDRDSFIKLRVPLPNVQEQGAITEILSTVDEAMQKTDEVIERAQRLKRGLMQDLLIKGIGHDEFKDVKLGPRKMKIPEIWEIRKLGGKNGLCEVVTGGTPRTTNEEYWNGDIHWIVPTDITSNGGIYISTSERKITQKGLDSSSANILPPGSVLLTTRATIGEACINTVPMATNQGFKSLICGSQADNLFIYYTLQKEKERLASLGGGSTFDEVSSTDVRNFQIATPPLDEQKRIAEILFKTDENIEKEKNYKAALQKLKKGLMQDLLTGKVRVPSDGR